jgi:hypothetical protein
VIQASSIAAATNAAELEELNRKLKSSEDELDALNKRFDEAQGKPKLEYRNSFLPLYQHGF